MEQISVNHVTKDYGHGRGIFDVSFSIQKGEVFGFLGPNGAGKSTVIRHIMGFSKPDKGTITVLGQDTWKHYDKILGNVGYLPGEIALPAGLTGYQFIDMMKQLKGMKDDTFLKYLMKTFELDPSGETKRMSLGVKRKLAVVVAFMNDPDILILDEPTSGLDPVMQQVFIEFIKNEKKRGKTILLSSHMFGEVDATCDRIAIIKEGKIVTTFNAAELKHNTNKNYAITFQTGQSYHAFFKEYASSKDFRIVDTLPDERKMIVNIEDANINCLTSALAKYKIQEFHHMRKTLEEHFMSYYKEDTQFGGV